MLTLTQVLNTSARGKTLVVLPGAYVIEVKLGLSLQGKKVNVS